MPGASYICPAQNVEAVNAVLEAAGYGPVNFETALDTGAVERTHYVCHTWENPDFIAAVDAITGKEISKISDVAMTERTELLITARGLTRQVEQVARTAR